MKKLSRFSIFNAVRLCVAMGLLQALCACGSPKRDAGAGASQAQARIEQQLAHLSTLRYIDDIVKARKQVADSLDVQALQASPHRDRLLHAWLHLYTYDADLLPDAREMINRMQKDTTGIVKKPLVQALCNALLEDGREEAATILAAHSRGYYIEQGTQSEVALRMLRQVTLPGQTAPRIAGLDTGGQPANQLVVFYESDCGNCLVLLEELTKCYPGLQKQGVQVITISVDTAPEVYQGLTSTFPWPDKVCDFRGFYGENPKQWGVSATPAIYRVNDRGVVTDWHEDLEEAIEQMEQNER